VLLGWSVFTDFLGGYLGLPAWLVDTVSNFSFKTHFDPFIRGILDPRISCSSSSLEREHFFRGRRRRARGRTRDPSGRGCPDKRVEVRLEAEVRHGVDEPAGRPR